MAKSCLAPHEIRPGDLMTYLEGVAPLQVVQHIDRCPACSSEVAALRQIDSLLAGAFAQNHSSVTAPLAGQPNDLKVAPRSEAADLNRKQFIQRTISRSRLPSRRMIMVAVGQVLILLGLLAGVYYFFQYPFGRSVTVTPQAQPLETVAVVTSKIAEMNLSLSDQVSTEEDDPSQQTKGITEKVSAIAPPRYILKTIEEELQDGTGHLLVYYLEEASAITPPRALLKMLEEELKSQNKGFLSYWLDDLEPYWSESIVLDPHKDSAYLVRLTVQHHISTIFFAHSTDDGQNWSEEIPIHRKRSSLFNPSLAADAQGNLYIVWQEGRNLAANIYFASSTDGGQTWSRGTRLNNDLGQNFEPSLAVGDEGALYITWQNPRNNHTNIYFVRSTDGGQTWSPETRIARVGS